MDPTTTIKCALLFGLFVSILAFGTTSLAEEPLPPPPPPPAADSDGDPLEQSDDAREIEEPVPEAPQIVPQPSTPSGDRNLEERLQKEPRRFSESPPPNVPEAPGSFHRLIRVSALTLAAYSFLAFTPLVAIGLDIALFGQEFHDQARTFSALNATIGVLWASTTVWPLGLALDGNGDFWATTIGAAAAGAASIGVMYVYSDDDPDDLLAQSFTPGVMAFVTAIVIYEMTSDTSADYTDETGSSDAWITLSPALAPTTNGGVAVGLQGRF